MVLVPNSHYLVHAPTVYAAGQAAHLLDEVTEKLRSRRKFLVIYIAIQGLVQSEDELRHVIASYLRKIERLTLRLYTHLPFNRLKRCHARAATKAGVRRPLQVYDGVDAPPTASMRQSGGVEHHLREASVSEVIIIGLDIAKHVFHAHGDDERARAV